MHASAVRCCAGSKGAALERNQFVSVWHKDLQYTRLRQQGRPLLGKEFLTQAEVALWPASM